MKHVMYVNYEVLGKKFQAGPYTADDVFIHFADIKHYEAVTKCYISLVRDEERQLMP